MASSYAADVMWPRWAEQDRDSPKSNATGPGQSEHHQDYDAQSQEAELGKASLRGSPIWCYVAWVWQRTAETILDTQKPWVSLS